MCGGKQRVVGGTTGSWTISVVVFSLEYLGRIWTCTLLENYSHPIKGRLKFIFSPIGLIDLLAILPWYLPFIMNIDGRILRLLRLFRLVRIFKMGRYSTAFKMISNVLKRRKEELLVNLYYHKVIQIVG